MLADLRNLVAHHELIANFAGREIKAKYKQAALGVTWAVLQPLLQILVMTLVFSYFARVPTGNVPYPLFLFTAFLPWMFFAGAMSRGTTALTNLGGLITKIYFPRESLVLAALLAALVDFGIAASLYLGMVIYYGVPVSGHVVFVLPIFLAQTILVLGIMLWVAPLNTFYRDIGQFMPVFIQFWMYLTPIMYPSSLVPARFRDLYYLNPMAGVMDGYRAVILRHEMPDAMHLAYAYAVGILVLVFGYLFFKRVEMKLADVA